MTAVKNANIEVLPARLLDSSKQDIERFVARQALMIYGMRWGVVAWTLQKKGLIADSMHRVMKNSNP